jgi:NAD-dependent SIR2 family protein deacetylase
MTDLTRSFYRAAELIAGADALVIGAGAGMGVDSGLPDFRGREGFWNAYPALARAKLDFTQVANPATFEKDPMLAWGFYGHRLDLYRKTVPHEGFQILRKWSEEMMFGSWIFTSNVDGQFQKAGFADDQIHECHGSIHHFQCKEKCERTVWSADGFMPHINEDACHLTNEPPTCSACGSLARPNILMFGDWNWLESRTRAQSRREDQWLYTVESARARVVIVELGAGTAIPSVRHFSHSIISRYDGRLIRINPQESQVPGSADVSIPKSALEGLLGIQSALDEVKGRGHDN